jgi:hypothetical protein
MLPQFSSYVRFFPIRLTTSIARHVSGPYLAAFILVIACNSSHLAHLSSTTSRLPSLFCFIFRDYRCPRQTILSINDALGMRQVICAEAIIVGPVSAFPSKLWPHLRRFSSASPGSYPIPQNCDLPSNILTRTLNCSKISK